MLLIIGLGGAIGATARYLIEVFFPSPPSTIPWATFFINISGSFILGLVIALSTEIWPPSPYRRAFLGVGFCGGYTTFSTWMIEVTTLAAKGEIILALVYVLASLVLGVVAVGGGIFIIQKVGNRQ